MREEVIVPNVSNLFDKESLKEDQQMRSDWHEFSCKFPFSSFNTLAFFHNLSPKSFLKASYFQRMGTKVFQHYPRCLQSGFARLRKDLIKVQEVEDEITSFLFTDHIFEMGISKPELDDGCCYVLMPCLFCTFNKSSLETMNQKCVARKDFETTSGLVSKNCVECGDKLTL